jgi:hypothetical protein
MKKQVNKKEESEEEESEYEEEESEEESESEESKAKEDSGSEEEDEEEEDEESEEEESESQVEEIDFGDIDIDQINKANQKPGFRLPGHHTKGKSVVLILASSVPNYDFTTNDNKSVYTKASEELYAKLMNSKGKVNSQDYFFNHQYLNKVKQRNTKTSNQTFVNFVQRNNEYRQKKELRLQERLEKLESELPNPNKVVENPRTLEQFNEDQARFLAFKDEKMRQRKAEQEAMDMDMYSGIPEISKKSKEIAQVGGDDKDVYNRLFQERAKKKKISILTPSTDKKEKRPVTKEEVIKTVANLYTDAIERKNRRTKSMEIEMGPVDLTTVSCNTVLINGLLNDFKNAVQFDINAPVLLTLPEYTNILNSLGFVKHRDENAKKYFKDREDTVVNDSWNVLEGSRENSDSKIDTNQLFVFCACVSGLYNGEKEKGDSIFKAIFPGADLTNYYYPSRTAKQMKILFRYFYENRVDFLMERKRLAKPSKSGTDFNKSASLTKSKKKTMAYSNYRTRIMNEIENESEMKATGKSFNYLHDAFKIKRKKKERYG